MNSLIFKINFRRNTLLDAVQHGDFTAEKFKEIQRRIETNIQNVNPAEEYRDFTEKHKLDQHFLTCKNVLLQKIV